jgi:AraC family transcriptional regulator, transcriptional activator of pobA
MVETYAPLGLPLPRLRKLIEAKRQLVYTRSSVAEIAYGLGFGDSSHFTSFFSRHVGVTPVGFRKRHLFQQE